MATRNSPAVEKNHGSEQDCDRVFDTGKQVHSTPKITSSKNKEKQEKQGESNLNTSISVQDKIKDLEFLAKTGLCTNKETSLSQDRLQSKHAMNTSFHKQPIVEVSEEIGKGGSDDDPVPPTHTSTTEVSANEAKKDIGLLVDAINSMQKTMQANSLKMESKFHSLKECIGALHEKFEKQEQTLQEAVTGFVNKSELLRLEDSLTELATQTDSKFDEMSGELSELKSRMDRYCMNNIRLERRLAAAEEKLQFHDIKSNRFSLTIEGLLESKDKDAKTQLIKKVNGDAQVDLKSEEIVSIRRIGKVTKYRKNRSIALVVRDEMARNKVLRARGKLTPEIANTAIWINEEVPATYRRRKSMLRDLVKLAITKKYQAKIDQGGINLDGKLYLPHQFDKLPQGLQPHDACAKETDNQGIAFASEWTPLSNMFRTEFSYKDIWYNSAEQAYQYQKAVFHGQQDLADDIIITTDPYECKKLGGRTDDSDKWDKTCEEKMAEILDAKFKANPSIAETLINTGEATLYEATQDNFWGINCTLHSKEAREEKGTGQNKLGYLLMALRVNLINDQSVGSQSEESSDDEGDSMDEVEE